MATPATVTIRGIKVPLTGASDVCERLADVVSSSPFADWVRDLDEAMVVRNIHIQSVDWFGPRVGFVKFVCDATFNGKRIPGIVFARGGAVAILPVLECGGAQFVLCCRQPRLPCGSSSFLEIPAGMLDGSGHFTGVAAKEMEEETGLVMYDDELVDLTALAYGNSTAGRRGVYPSVGACDEFLRLFLYRTSMSVVQLESLRGKATGNMQENEMITLEVVPLEELWRRAPDAKTLCALHLYERLRSAGVLPE